MKYLILVSILSLSVLLLSCNQKQRNDPPLADDSSSPAISITVNESDEDMQEYYDTYFKNYSYKDIIAFEIKDYHESDYARSFLTIMDTMVGLFKSDNKYHLKKCFIEKVNVYENECEEVVMIPALNTDEKCLYLFKGLKKYNSSGDVKSVFEPFHLWVHDNKKFDFGGSAYELRAEGQVLDTNMSNKDAIGYWEVVKDYKLYFSANGKTQCIVHMKKYNESMTEISWVGDLDGDNKPDFIINSPEGENDYRILLFLSSFAEGDELVKLVSILNDVFSC